MANKLVVALALGTAITSAALTAASAAPPVRAAMTCREFMSFDEVTRPKVVYWAEGLNRKGRPQDAVVDVADTERLIPIVSEECRKAPQASFWDKLEASWTRAKKNVERHL